MTLENIIGDKLPLTGDDVSKNTAYNKDFETSTGAIKENGAVSVGASANIARSDHVHPPDTEKADDALVVHLAGAEVVTGDKTIIPALTITGGLKDADATTAIALAESGETSLNTTKKSITGAVNENKSRIDFLFGVGAGTTKTDPAIDAITVSDVDDFLACAINLTAAGNSQTLPSPSNTSLWRSFEVLNNGASTDNISINGVILEPGESAKFFWSQTEWIREDDSGILFDDGTRVYPQRSPRAFSSQSFLFDLAYASAVSEGEMAWNSDTGTMRMGMPGGAVVLDVGQEMHLPNRPKNVEGSQIDNGQLVYIYDAVSAIPQVKLASAADFQTAKGTIAMATEDVPNNSRGFYTTFGGVKEVNTALYPEGTKLYLDVVAGGYEALCPEPPNACVEIGIVTRQHETEGEIFVTIYFSFALFSSKLTKEPTLFSDPLNVDVSYEWTTRKVTLGGTVNAYYQGVPFTEVFSGYVSPAHDSAFGVYFLVYDGISISWKAPALIKFYDLLIAYAIYQSGYKIAFRECHGGMPWQAHEELHKTLGTFRDEGGIIGDYILNSTTPSDRRPSVSQALLYDEDLPTLNAALATGGPYTQMSLSDSETAVFDTTPLDVVPLLADRPYFNELSGGSYIQTLIDNNRFMSIWLIAVPTTSDVESQKYRFVWQQGQSQSALKDTEAALSTNSVSLGELESLSPESVFIAQIIINYTAANWKIVEVKRITGTRVSQSQGSSGVVQNEYSDALLRVYSDTDSSARIALNASKIDTGTTRTLTVPNKSGTISLSEIDVNDQSDNYDLLISDATKLVRVDTTTSTYYIRFPGDSIENIPINSWGEIKNIGTNDLWLIQQGASFQSEFGNVDLKVVGTYGFSVFWHKTAANTFEISGSVVPL